MAKPEYTVTGMTRFINRIAKMLIGWGLAPRDMVLLTVIGRKSGKAYSLPVSLVEYDGQRWLVSPYGEVNWVKNARAAGQVTLSRSNESKSYQIEELDAEASAPILKAYLNENGITQPYFHVEPDAPVDDFQQEAANHPVFKLK